ncbi:MAG: RHS repeat protein [Proteobacteria bacterium]|nr:RHS repeat protein [Pseudomonadota bacterium]
MSRHSIVHQVAKGLSAALWIIAVVGLVCGASAQATGLATWVGCTNLPVDQNRVKGYLFAGIDESDEGAQCYEKAVANNILGVVYGSTEAWAKDVRAKCDGSRYNNTVNWYGAPYPNDIDYGVYDLNAITDGFDYGVSAQALVQCATGDYVAVPGIPDQGKKNSDRTGASRGEPIDPRNGNEFAEETDYVDPKGRLTLTRTYNSEGVINRALGLKWRHNFDSIIIPAYNLYDNPNSSDQNASSIYNDAADACVSGWPQIAKAAARIWPSSVGATASFNVKTNTCQLSSGQTLPVYSTMATPSGAMGGLEAGVSEDLAVVRSDGHIYQFSCANGVCSAEFSDIPVSLDPNTTSFSYTDENGDIQSYNAMGGLTSITYKNGDLVTLTYDQYANLQSVSDRYGRALVFTLNGSGYLGQVTDPTGSAIAYGYQNDGLLQSVTYPGGKQRSYTYDSVGLADLTGIVDENSSTYAAISYDSSGRANGNSLAGGVDAYSIVYNSDNSATITDPFGVVRTNHYQNIASAFKITSITGAVCPQCVEAASTTYDSNGYIAGATDWNGNQTSYQINSNGLLHQETDAQGSGVQRTITTDWTVFRNPLDQTIHDDVANKTTSQVTWTYNTRGQALTYTRTDPVTSASRAWTYTYCEQAGITAGTCPQLGLLLAVDGPRTDVSDVTSYAYYASDDPSCASAPTTCPHRQGDLWKVTDALGHATTFLRYDGAGRPLALLDVNNVETDLTYSPRGWLTQVAVRATNGASGAGDELTGYAYDNTGNLTRITRADGSWLGFTYDAAHRLTDLADNLGDTIHYTLDNAGDRLREDTKDPTGALRHSVVRQFNSLGQLATTLNADGKTVNARYGYDPNGNPTTYTDGRGTLTQSSFDALNRLNHVDRDPGTGSHVNANIIYALDALDRITKVTDPQGLNTAYTYDGLGNPTQLASPDTGTATSTFDAAGNRSTRTDARGIKATYSYDALNRVTTVVYPTAALKTTYTWDTPAAICSKPTQAYSVGRLSAVTDGSGSTQFCYDRYGNRVKKQQTINGKAFVTSYAYDLAHHLTQETTPRGTVIGYTRDAAGRVVQVTEQPAGGKLQTLVKAVSYAPFGPVTGITYGNGRTLTRSYDADYVIHSIADAGAGGLSLSFGRDAIGNLTQIASGSTGNILQYDPLNRLTTVNDLSSKPQWTYAYDATGNRLSAQQGAAAAVPYTYPTSSHRLLAVGTTLRGYDAAGDTTTIGSGAAAQVFHYDDSGRMDQRLDGAGHVQMQYATNALGQRVEKYLSGNAAATQYAIRDEAGQVLGEYDGNANRVREVVWLDNLPVGVLSGTAGSLSYLEPDQLGTPRVAIDGTSNTQTWSWSPLGDPFGQTQPTGALNLDLRMPGQVYDAESGLDYNYFRDYEPGTGRFPESDPLGLLAGVSTYAYVGGNPLSRTDRFGLEDSVAVLVGSGVRSQMPERGYPAWQNDTPSNPTQVACDISHYWSTSNGNPEMARDQSQEGRGVRGPNQLGYDLSLRDANHYYEAYSNPSLALVIPFYEVAKLAGFDYPQASAPSWSEISWAEAGAWDGLRGNTPPHSSGGKGQCGCH